MRLMNGGLPAALARAYPTMKWDETRFKAVPRMIFYVVLLLFCCCFAVVLLLFVCCLFVVCLLFICCLFVVFVVCKFCCFLILE